MFTQNIDFFEIYFQITVNQKRFSYKAFNYKNQCKHPDTIDVLTYNIVHYQKVENENY